jgi:hypothetical protein
MSKRVKINFETVNKGKYEIIPPEKIAESRKRIAENMRRFIRKPKPFKYDAKRDGLEFIK